VLLSAIVSILGKINFYTMNLVMKKGLIHGDPTTFWKEFFFNFFFDQNAGLA
jgi:hypothetical protein